MIRYQPEEEFRTLRNGRDLRIRRYDRANRWFTIGKHLYFGCDDLARWHCKRYPAGSGGCFADLFTNIHFDYVLQIGRKIPEFDEFDSGDHSFIYFIFSSRRQADRLFEAIRSRLSSLEYAECFALHSPCVVRRGLLDLSLDIFAVYEEI